MLLIFGLLVRKEKGSTHHIQDESKLRICAVVFPPFSLTLINSYLFAFMIAAEQ